MTDMRDIVDQSISNRGVIHIVYRSYHGSVTERDITPLEWVNDQQFRALCHLRGDERNFRVDRIIKCAPAGGSQDLTTTDLIPQPVSREIKKSRPREKVSRRKKERSFKSFSQVRNPNEWSRLVLYYVECLIRENQQQYVIRPTQETCFFFPAPVEMIREFLEGRTSLEFETSQRGNPRSVSRFINQVKAQKGQHLCLGFPVYIIENDKIVPLVFAPLEVEESDDKVQLRAQDPEPSYAVLKNAGFTDEEIEATLTALVAAETGDSLPQTEVWETLLISKLSEILDNFTFR